MTDLRMAQWPLSLELTEILQELVGEKSQGIILDFIDHGRNADVVEIRIDSDGKISFLGVAKPSGEGREKPWLAFDFAHREYRHTGNTEDIKEGINVFRAWQIQFCRNFQKYEVKYNEYTV